MSLHTKVPALDSGAVVAAAEQAGRMIPPLWPLASSVAVNPFLGQTRETLADTGARLARVGAVPVTMFQERVRFGSFFYIGAVLGLGAVMLDTGLSRAIGDALLQVVRLEEGADATNFISLSVLATLASMIVTNPAQPALLAPLAGSFAEAAGWPIQAALMTMAVGFSTLLLPYQAPPVVVGMQLAALRVRDALRLTVPLALISVFVLIPVHYLWWRIIGYFSH